MRTCRGRGYRWGAYLQAFISTGEDGLEVGEYAEGEDRGGGALSLLFAG